VLSAPLLVGASIAVRRSHLADRLPNPNTAFRSRIIGNGIIGHPASARFFEETARPGDERRAPVAVGTWLAPSPPAQRPRATRR
jgi:hypothetical protein